MAKTFQEALSELVFYRGIEAAGIEARKDPEFIKYDKEEERLTAEIKKLLGGKEALLTDLMEAMLLSSCVVIKYAYKYGLKEGIQLMNEKVIV